METFGDIFQLSPILIFVFVFLATIYIKDILFRDTRLPPGPVPWPIIGNMPSLAGKGSFLKKLLKLRDKYGDVVYLKLGPNLKFVAVFGHKLFHEILVEKGHLTKFRPENIYFAERFSQRTGIFFSNGEHWQNLRKFTIVTLKDFGVGKKSLAIRTKEEADILCELIAKNKSRPISLENILPNATSNIISGIIFGSRFEYDDPEFNRLLGHLTYFFQNASISLPENIFPFLENLPFSKVDKIMKNLNDIFSFIRKQIKKHEETYDPNCIRDIIDLYIQHARHENKNDNITEKDLLYVIRDLYNAGSETTATSLKWVILYMTKYPDLQKRCREEIAENIGDRFVTMDDRAKLPYLEAFIHEVQRVACIAPIASVHCSLECDIEIGGKLIPKGTGILPVIATSHFDENYWENPEEFRPERFLDKDGKRKINEAFYPFGIGPRTCLGKQLGEMELFVFLTTFLQRFEFQHADPDNITLEGSNDGPVIMPLPYRVYAKERS